MPSEYTMKLERGVTIGGGGGDDTGKPIGGGEGTFDGPGHDMSLGENIQFGPDTPGATGTTGHWVGHMIPTEDAQISGIASHRDYAETNVSVHPAAADATRLVIVMPAGYSVAGVVVQESSGKPIEAATVRQVRLNEERERSRKTDASGVFELTGMGGGEL